MLGWGRGKYQPHLWDVASVFVVVALARGVVLQSARISRSTLPATGYPCVLCLATRAFLHSCGDVALGR
eukprot:7101607-Pyramimonas_sp.AAC.1